MSETSNRERLEATGPWPFVTHRVLTDADGSRSVWSSRHHRKRLVLPEAARAIAFSKVLIRAVWLPTHLNWWIGILFAVGSALFALASVFSLAPILAKNWSLTLDTINAFYFAGSIPFTVAAYLQLFQAANAGPHFQDASRSRRRIRLLGWRPGNIGWLSCASQFAGTILFNFNTFDATIPQLTWLNQDLLIWLPDIVGSTLFLIAGYLAFIETCHAHWAWQPCAVSWWIVFVNLLGCIGFMASAVCSLVLPGPPDTQAITLAISFTLQGAICFLVSALLLLPETAFAGAD